MNKLQIKSGFVYGEKLVGLFDYCKEVGCAIPAVNVSSSGTINAALAAAATAEAPIILQLSHSGSAAFAGFTLNNQDHQASILGAVSVAMYVKALALAYDVPVIIHSDHCPKNNLAWVEGLLSIGADYYQGYGEPLFSSHMLDLSVEPLAENLKISARFLRKMAELEMLLEIEVGLTGGEEDGLNNEAVASERLYSKPEDVYLAYEKLSALGNLNIAAAFGNVHGVYANKSAKLKPEILQQCQAYAVAQAQNPVKVKDKPLSLVFHGGSGSDPAKIKAALKYGIVKFNLDTDIQWAFSRSVKIYMDKNDQYLHSQIGNNRDRFAPNKKYYDPRVWQAEGEKGETKRLLEMYRLLNCQNKFEILD